jgi:hypothetical protein
MTIRRGNDFDNVGGTWTWPDVPDFGSSRLNLSRLTGENFGRLAY